MKAKAGKRVVMLAVPPIMELDLVGPVSIFQGANYYLQKKARPPLYRIEVIAAGAQKTLRGDCGLSILSARRFAEFAAESMRSAPIDTLLVVGGSGALKAKDSNSFVQWLRKHAPRIRRIGSICTGAFVLAAAGLLDHRRATTHWQYCQRLAAHYPHVEVERDPIFVRDGSVYTSAGVTAGMDLVLEMVEEDLGGAIPLEIAQGLVIFLRRPGGQNQFSVSLTTAQPRQTSMRALPAWILENIDQPLPIELLAQQAAMSSRNFARLFTAEFGMTPARYVLAQRVEAARRALTGTKLAQKEIAARCGFGNTEHLRRAFLRFTGVTPGSYRSRFHGNGKKATR